MLNDKRLLTVGELAEYLKRSEGAVRNLVYRQKIPYKKVGGRICFDEREIERWIDQAEGMRLEEISR